ncbi:MAG: hypothetical protein K9M57_10610 [Phycisphaerae bacterium]|nr:hypothetical protein [Phycisphaerae bacterium]
MGISILVKSVLIDNLHPIGNPEMDIIFQVEVYESTEKNTFFPVVWSKESYRMNPTFPLDKVNTSDEMVLTEEESLGWDEISGKSPQEVLDKVIMKIKEWCDFRDDSR